MDANRWSNILNLQRDYAEGRPRLSGRPLEAYIEVAARCNLRCQMCPITVDPRYDPGSGLPGLLSREMFDRLEPLFPTLNRAHLFGLGEPLLHPDLAEFTGRLAAAGVEVWITTNGTLVTGEHADALARAGLARVTVSIDGATAETYERIRRRGRFEDVVRGLRALGEARRRHGRPELFLSLIAMASNLHELPRLLDLCAEIGGDGVFVEGLYPYPHPIIEDFYGRENLGHLEPGRFEELVEEGRRRAGELGLRWVTRMEQQVPPSSGPVAAVEQQPVLPWACSEPWQAINVNASGDVRTCCFNDDVLGSLAGQTMEGIWNGEAYAALRADQAAGRVSPGCETCVRNGRVKRSAYLLPREELVPGPDGGLEILLPAEGDLITDPLVVVGRLRRDSWWRRPKLDRDRLPELWIDQFPATWLGDLALIDEDRFAAVLPIPYLSEGAHRLTFRPRGGSPSWGSHTVQMTGRRDALAAVSRVAVPVHLLYPEPKPTLQIGGRRHPVESWLCESTDTGWMGVALIGVEGIAPGSYDLELRFRNHDPCRNRLDRLAVEGAGHANR